MTEAEWLTSTDPAKMVEAGPSHGDPRRRRLFAVACCRRVGQFLTRPGRAAVAAAEAYADGLTSEGDLRAAWKAVGYPQDHVRGAAAAAARAAAARTADHPGDYDGTAQAAACVREVMRRFAEADDGERGRAEEAVAHAALLRCIFGNPFRAVAAEPGWRTEAVVALATTIYDERAFDRLPVLADALEDAGCADAEVIGHCRGPGPHARGCWVVDLLLGKR